MMKIVEARPEDIPQIIDIQTECNLSRWTAEGYGAALADKDSVFVVVKDEEMHVAGFLVGRSPRSPAAERFGDEAEIHNIGTRIAVRRMGVGTLLITRFIEECRDRRLKKVWLEVRAGNSGAINFYTLHGFEALATRPGFYSSPVEDATVMVLELEREGDS